MSDGAGALPFRLIDESPLLAVTGETSTIRKPELSTMELVKGGGDFDSIMRRNSGERQRRPFDLCPSR
jgi:hypothetical protein